MEVECGVRNHGDYIEDEEREGGKAAGEPDGLAVLGVFIEVI